MLCMRLPSSLVLFSSIALYSVAASWNSPKSSRNSPRSGPSTSYWSKASPPSPAAASMVAVLSTVATVGLKAMTDWKRLKTICSFSNPPFSTSSATMLAITKDMPSLLFAVSTTTWLTLAANAPRASCARPFSPTRKKEVFVPSSVACASIIFVYFTTVELMPPHSPLSEVMGSSRVVAAAAPGAGMRERTHTGGHDKRQACRPAGTRQP